MVESDLLTSDALDTLRTLVETHYASEHTLSWFQRRILRRTPPQKPASPRITDVRLWPTASFLNHQRIFQVGVDGHGLPWQSLPRGAWVFAVEDSDKNLSLLLPSDASLSTCIERDGRPLDELPLLPLLQFISSIRLAVGFHRVRLVPSLSDLIRWDAVSGFQGYEVLPTLQDTLLERFVPPSIDAYPSGGYELTFTTLEGWMHETRQLCTQRVEVFSNHEIFVHRSKVLHKNVFTEVPFLRY